MADGSVVVLGFVDSRAESDGAGSHQHLSFDEAVERVRAEVERELAPPVHDDKARRDRAAWYEQARLERIFGKDYLS